MATQTSNSSKASPKDIQSVLKEVLNTIDRDREREIVSRRFGLYDRKETLEQIGELLGITRERVRQLEKVVVIRLKTAAANGEIAHIAEVQQTILDILENNGHIMRISELAGLLTPDGSKIDQSRIAFLATLSPNIAVIEENDNFFGAAGVKKIHDEKKIKEQVNKIIEAIKKLAEPVTIEKICELTGEEDGTHAASLASISKQLAHLNNKWGLVKWPTVNPKNIRDKIYVILQESGGHMHFNEIAEAIRVSTFKRKDVTTQAIHNELIKDKRFVLIGRGIYALQEWGYKKGTVSDMIAEVLEESGEPLHRDEIVKRVLKHRHVKETTILLNLQSKSQFRRVAKATYTLAIAE